MAIYNCNYPVLHTINNLQQNHQDYTVSIGSTTIYTGRIYYKSTESQTETIDLSPLFREYIDVFYENINLKTAGVFNLPVVNNVGSIRTFTVTDSSGTYTYDVVYNYNTDYIRQSDDVFILREAITLEVDPRQMLFVSGYSTTGTVAYTAVNSAGGTAAGSGNQGVISGLAVDLSAYNLAAGDYVDMTGAGSRLRYNVVTPCRNRFAVYYVNKYGGLEALLCRGKAEEGWNRTNIQVSLYADRLNPYDFGQKSIRTDIDHSLTLRTGFVPIGRERNIDHLVNTNRIWVHDLEKDLIWAAQITQNSFKAEERRYNKTLQYTFSVSESQKQIRR
ncbi:MAG: hypothetical protein LUH10_00425 [Tannerellaceae bacterium]|nr:hypothetical protein [Tannerellaceae bacterium]